MSSDHRSGAADPGDSGSDEAGTTGASRRRRGLLRVGAATLAGLAGCSRRRDATADRSRAATADGTTSTPDGTAATADSAVPVRRSPGPYGRWLYDPGAVTFDGADGGDRRSDGYGFSSLDIADMRVNRAHLGGVYTVLERTLARSLDRVRVEWAQLRRVVLVGASPGATVLTGGFDAAAVAAGLRGEGYRRRSSHRGYDLYRRPADPPGRIAVFGRVVAVRDGVVVAGRGADGSPDRTLAAVRAVVDADRRAVDRYADAVEPVRALAASLGSGTFVSGAPAVAKARNSPVAGTPRPSLDGQVAAGRATVVEGTTSRLRVAVVFESSAAVDSGRVRSWVERRRDAAGALGAAGSVAVRSAGRVVVVDATVPTAAAFGGRGETTATPTDAPAGHDAPAGRDDSEGV